MAIIAISGYAGSGKDLAAKLIQHMHLPTAAKEKAADLDAFVKEDTDWWLEDSSDWHIMKFAGKLKVIASILTSIPLKNFENQEFKKTTLGPQWDFADADAPDNIMTVRMFLQKLGTDGLRNGLHTNVWVNALFADYIPTHHDHAPNGLEYPNWLITDCRFENEAQAVKDHGGIIIRIDRPGVTAVNAHPSETALDGYDFDERVINDGSIQDLYEKLQFIIEKQNVCYP